MLRRRLERLELRQPRSAGDLIEQWDRRALALLSIEDRELVNDTHDCRGRARSLSHARAAANERYQANLAELIEKVSIVELDRMLAFFGVPSRVDE